jgi:bifunctional UDP-N-acetylglucosamine pyrophosphorylase/glucosamine-1-phosphate N-acetyltransferase
MKQLNVVILAAGKGERMLSKKPKVMHEIMGKPMIGYAVERAKELNPASITVVTGFGRENVEAFLEKYNVNFSVQTEQKGTAHAVLTASRFINSGDILILYGDVPLMEYSTLNNFISFQNMSGNITFMTTLVDNPSGYGRVLMEGNIIKDIIEDADATAEEKSIQEINTGICIIPEEYFSLLGEIENNNKKGEYYLTDICRVAKSKNLAVKAFHYDTSSEVLGVNGRKELLDANLIMKDKILDIHLRNGVTLLDRNIYIESDVTIGNDTIIYPNSYIMGKTCIGRNTFLGPNTMIKNSTLHDNVHIEGFSVLEGAEIQKGSVIGPFSKILPVNKL